MSSPFTVFFHSNRDKTAVSSIHNQATKRCASCIEACKQGYLGFDRELIGGIVEGDIVHHRVALHPLFDAGLRYLLCLARCVKSSNTDAKRTTEQPTEHVKRPDLFDAPCNVVKENFARRERRDRVFKMFFEIVIRKLKTLFGAIGPKVAVH